MCLSNYYYLLLLYDIYKKLIVIYLLQVPLGQLFNLYSYNETEKNDSVTARIT